MNSNVTFRTILKIENILLRIAITNIKRKKKYIKNSQFYYTKYKFKTKEKKQFLYLIQNYGE